MDMKALQGRVGLYSLLRRLYTYPLTAQLLVTLVDLQTKELPMLAPALSQMRRYVLRTTAGTQNDVFQRVVEDLNVEMTRLFEGPGAPAAPPYASYYLHGGRLMGPEAIAVRRIYVRWQALPTNGLNLPADHIALELGFLAYLAQQAMENEREQQAAALRASLDFLDNHLLSWIPRFLEALRASARDDFFRGVGHLTEAVLQQDVRWLTSVLMIQKSV